jgi:hypothetical protein
VTRSIASTAAGSIADAAAATPSSHRIRPAIASADTSSSRSSNRRSPITVAQAG